MRFWLSVEGGWDLDETGFWPDGDAPENPTSEQAAERCREFIDKEGWYRFLHDWNLDELTVHVDDALVAVEGRVARGV